MKMLRGRSKSRAEGEKLVGVVDSWVFKLCTCIIPPSILAYVLLPQVMYIFQFVFFIRERLDPWYEGHIH